MSRIALSIAAAFCIAIMGTSTAHADEGSPLDQYLYGKEKHESSARLDVSGPQLLDYTEARDAEGHSYFWPVVLYIGIGWVLCPILFGVMAMRPGTRGLGFVLLLLWFFFFAIPRFIEFIALFIVLPSMIAGGLFKGAIKQLK